MPSGDRFQRVDDGVVQTRLVMKFTVMIMVVVGVAVRSTQGFEQACHHSGLACSLCAMNNTVSAGGSVWLLTRLSGANMAEDVYETSIRVLGWQERGSGPVVRERFDGAWTGSVRRASEPALAVAVACSCCSVVEVRVFVHCGRMEF